MYASTWLLVAIISCLVPDYWGFAIALEGLFILYLALKENYYSVRIEAYSLLVFSLAHGIFAIFPYFPDPALLTLQGNLVVASIGGIIFASRKILNIDANKTGWEIQLKQKLRPIESIWLSLFILSLLWLQLAEWMAIALLPLQVLLLSKSYRKVCKVSEVMVYLTGLTVIAISILGIIEVQSLSFRDLPNYAKTSLVFVFLECWLLAEFYRRTGRTGTLAHIAETLRLAFYLILPLTFLPSAFKHYSELSAIAVWCSALISYLLGQQIQHRLLRIQALLIFILAAVYNLVFTIDFYQSQLLLSVLANVMGLTLFSYFLIKIHKRHLPLLDKKIASISLYYLAGCIAIYMQEWTNIVWAGIATSSYIFALTLYLLSHKILIRNRRTLGYINFFNILLSWLCSSVTGIGQDISSSIWLALSLAVLLTFLIKAQLLSRLHLKFISNSKISYTLLHILLSINFAFLLAKWELALLITPCLILQGSYLFFTHKHSKFIAKLALAFMAAGLLKLGILDTVNALLWQKVVLMISIGIFMLAAAFIYQKRMNQTI
ncbi:hypothetical protein [Paraglaciecola sp. L3A3]|uniref:hypothetical protein n=1 Tax=Paraglaciecola sp. L3A3 TaxID=2686358 RepID=UPI001E560594|nr:hypothetical protein [Paraglaciecola sp. L3A3]